ncbi:MAG: MFS transporter [Caldilineaceae bacterium]
MSSLYPNWLRRVPFMGNAPVLTERQWRVLGIVALATMFGQYALVLLPLALPQIQVSLAISAAQMSKLSALIRLGALPAFMVALAADRFGRRRLFLAAVTGFALLTGATAFAPTIAVFATLQCLTRTFVTATSLLAGVIIVEEFPEEARGWGIGALSALTSIGGGVAAVLFAVVNLAPFGWRALYLIGLLALLVSTFFQQNLPETMRFQAQQRQEQQVAPYQRTVQPLARLVSAYPGRFLALSAIIFLVSLGSETALFYDLAYLQQAHGWQPWQISGLNVSAGFMAILGSAYAGQWSDRWGRKPVTVWFLAGLVIAIIGYFRGSAWLLPLLWAAMLFTSVGAGVALGTLRAELFPTAYRSTATGVMAVLATLGGAMSLALHSQLVNHHYSPWSALSLLALLMLGAPLLLPLLPETSQRRLEEIAPENG